MESKRLLLEIIIEKTEFTKAEAHSQIWQDAAFDVEGDKSNMIVCVLRVRYNTIKKAIVVDLETIMTAMNKKSRMIEVMHKESELLEVIKNSYNMESISVKL